MRIAESKLREIVSETIKESVYGTYGNDYPEPVNYPDPQRFSEEDYAIDTLEKLIADEGPLSIDDIISLTSNDPVLSRNKRSIETMLYFLEGSGALIYDEATDTWSV